MNTYDALIEQLHALRSEITGTAAQLDRRTWVLIRRIRRGARTLGRRSIYADDNQQAIDGIWRSIFLLKRRLALLASQRIGWRTILWRIIEIVRFEVESSRKLIRMVQDPKITPHIIGIHH